MQIVCGINSRAGSEEKAIESAEQLKQLEIQAKNEKIASLEKEIEQLKKVEEKA